MVGTLCFMSLGLLAGAVTKTTEGAVNMANFLVLPMAFLSGSFFPLDGAPCWIQNISLLLPLRHLNDGMLDVMVRGEPASAVLVPMAILAAFATVMTLVAARLFRWETRLDLHLVTRHDGRMTGPPPGTLVVDLSRALAGPHATMMLGDLGARVIKVEAPQGDDSRGWGPPFVQPDDEGYGRESTYFLSANRNKESIVLDLKTAEDRDVLLRLVGRADVLVENYRPGVLKRLGLGHDVLRELNPRLVVLSITGFGHDGPEGGRAGYDQIAQGEAGLMSLTGASPDDPQKVGVPVADLLAGIYGAYGVVAALHERSRTGVGTTVRTSLLAAMIGVHAFQGTRWTVGGQVGRAQGNHHPSISPYGLFRCADGAVQIAVGSEGLWRDLCAGIGLDPADARFATNGDRVLNREP